MQTSSPNPNQGHLLFSDLLQQLNPKHPLLKLAKTIPWEYFEQEFSPLYAHRGKPAKPIRLMVGLCILKHLENLSDQVLVERWLQNPYYQAFCGETVFQWELPCDSSDLTYFRKRIGEKGFEKIFAVSIHIHGEKAKEENVHSDTTVQEKNVTFPTDDKQYLKIIAHCLKLAKQNGLSLRRSYAQEIKEKKLALRFRQHPKNHQKARKAIKRFKTIAGVLLREIRRKLPEEELRLKQDRFAVYERVLSQKRYDKHKIYSLHEPHIYCITKGKTHKPYEFGTKVSITKTCHSNIIVGALAFRENIYDGHTLPRVLKQVKKLRDGEVKADFVDRGYRGEKQVNGTRIYYPAVPKNKLSKERVGYLQKQFRKRAGIEGVISHLKSGHRLNRNYLKGFVGDQINVLMSAAAFNFKKWMRAIIFWLEFLLFDIEFLCRMGSVAE